MNKITSCALAAILAVPVLAEETSIVNYGQSDIPAPTLRLIWKFERETSDGITYAVITGAKVANGEAVGEHLTGDIPVPQSLICSDGTPLIVTKIADGAFANQIGITSISIPLTIQSIGPRTFSGCTILSKIEVASENSWFSSPNGILYDKDGEELIACPARTETISLPQSMKRIGEEAFADCFRLKTISIPPHVDAIGDNAFLRCTLLESLAFNGDAPTTVGATPFNGTPEAMTIYVPQGNTTFGDVPGVWNERSTKYYIVPFDVHEHVDGDGIAWTCTVGEFSAHLGSDDSTSIVPSSTSGAVTVPGEISIGDKTYAITAIPDGAFKDCSEITAIAIPASITSIAADAFNGCSSLESIKVAGDNKFYSSRNGVLYSKDGKTLVKVPARFTFATKFTEMESTTKKDIVEIISSTHPIIELKSYDQVNSTTVTDFTPSISAAVIFDGVTNISDYAFTDCGLLPEGSTVTGTLVVTVDGKEAERKTGTFPLPIGTDTTNQHWTANISSQAGFYKDSVCLYHTVSDSYKTFSYATPIRIPFGITYGGLSFYNSHFTSIIGGNEEIKAHVGIKLSIQLDVGNAPDGSLSTVTAKGLPAGVKLVKTAVKEGRKVVKYIYTIEGTPSRAQSAKTVVLKVTNKKNKLNESVSFAIKVLAMPSWVGGKYNGVCFDGTTEIGSATATISAAGKLSGKIMVPSDDGKKALKLSYTAKGFSDFDEESNTFYGTATMRVNKQTVDVPFALSAYDGAGQLSLELPGMTAMLEQNTWKRGDIVATTIEVDGFKFKLSASGKVKWSGSVEGDNGSTLSVSGSTQLLSGPSALVYIPPKANLVGGWCQLFQLW